MVIIGLIIGGVLVGQDLITAAATRAQIAQIEKYNAAVNTFVTKYGGIPGDLSLTLANQFSFATDPSCTGQQGGRDGNGLIDGFTGSYTYTQTMGETAMFWVDLSTANLIDGSLGGAAIKCSVGGQLVLGVASGTAFIGNYFPASKIGRGSYLYVYETNNANWFGLSAINYASSFIASNPVLSVSQAYNMDKKMDDGLPLSGTVQAMYLNGSNTSTVQAPNGNPDTSSTCYNSSTNTYSLGVNNGSGPNCALSFKMQGAGR